MYMQYQASIVCVVLVRLTVVFCQHSGSTLWTFCTECSLGVLSEHLQHVGATVPLLVHT